MIRLKSIAGVCHHWRLLLEGWIIPSQKRCGETIERLCKLHVQKWENRRQDFLLGSSITINQSASILSRESENLLTKPTISCLCFPDLHEKAGMFQRLNEIEAEYPGSTILMIKRTCGSLAPVTFSADIKHREVSNSRSQEGIKERIPSFQEFQDLFASTKVLNLMEQLLGTQDIIGHPVWNLRCKTPRNEPTTVPWHQGK